MTFPFSSLASFFYLLGISAVYCGLPDGNCSISGQSCEFHDNVIAIFPNIYNLEECRLFCKDDPTCSHLTHYGEDNFPFSNTCILFSSCSSLNTCNDCTTADMSCLPLDQVQLYSASLEGSIGQNLLQFLPDVANETECRTVCLTVDNCNFYTYHLTTDLVYPGSCLLLSSLLEPITPCEHCKTGVIDKSRRCSFLMHGEMFNSGLLVTDTDRPTYVELIALGTCEVALFAVGGGGKSGHSTGSYDYGGGGGSGLVKYTTTNITGMSRFTVVVGAAWENSMVQNEEKTTIVEARAGSDGSSSNGGSGYSGGGASGGSSSSSVGGDGGTNGGYGNNGAGGSGGSGSNVEVEKIAMPDFILSPGKGGNENSRYGGGGGGLLINGMGAPGGHEGDGEGYGGGGWNTHEGKPGAVLLSYF